MADTAILKRLDELALRIERLDKERVRLREVLGKTIGKSGGDWIRGRCQLASFVTPACPREAPDCPTCQVAAEAQLVNREHRGAAPPLRSDYRDHAPQSLGSADSALPRDRRSQMRDWRSYRPQHDGSCESRVCVDCDMHTTTQGAHRGLYGHDFVGGPCTCGLDALLSEGIARWG